MAYLVIYGMLLAYVVQFLGLAYISLHWVCSDDVQFHWSKMGVIFCPP